MICICLWFCHDFPPATANLPSAGLHWYTCQTKSAPCCSQLFLPLSLSSFLAPSLSLSLPLSPSLSGAQSQTAIVLKGHPSRMRGVCKSLFWTQLCKTSAQVIGWDSRKTMETNEPPHGLQYASLLCNWQPYPSCPVNWAAAPCQSHTSHR